MLNDDGRGSFYAVEGIGYDFVPDVLDRSSVHAWIKTDDEDAFIAARSLMRDEGLLVGGSSGSAFAGALRWLKSPEGRGVAQTKGKNVVILLPDG
jgi:cystathionine beta-synthase